ncbi:MAG: HD domain-containing protein [Pirellulales bacterium]
MERSKLVKVLKALSFAAREHQGQFRKDGRTPYFAHVTRVMTIAAAFGVDDAEVLMAAVLHDTIEDTQVDRDELIEEFGERVAAWVAALSKDKRLPEEERERLYFDVLARAPVEVKLCKLADTIDNLIDCEGLSKHERHKKLDKARELVEIFTPGFPERWKHALDLTREQIRATEQAP